VASALCGALSLAGAACAADAPAKGPDTHHRGRPFVLRGNHGFHYGDHLNRYTMKSHGTDPFHAEVSAPARPNQAPRGFKALFNGKDLSNWQGLIELPKRDKMSPAERKAAQAAADELMRQHWSVENGVLIYDGKGQSLQSVKDYGDVEFYVDWKILPKGDSGIYLRGTPQVQIWDPTGPALANGRFIGSGGLYNNQKNPSKPIAVADRPVGEWNTFYIKMVGDRVTVKLNDQVVVDNTPLENYWDRSKPLPATGPIELQHHGNRLEFRNIYVRELK
jgi:hypothetical protein